MAMANRGQGVSRELRYPRALLTVATLIYGVLPALADLSPTHVFHPAWTPHARLHAVWLIGTLFLMGALAMHLLWRSAMEERARVRLAGLLALCALGGFLLSAFTQGLFGGALSDPEGGIPRPLGLDLNLVVFSAAFVLVLVALGMTQKFRR